MPPELRPPRSSYWLEARWLWPCARPLCSCAVAAWRWASSSSPASESRLPCGGDALPLRDSGRRRGGEKPGHPWPGLGRLLPGPFVSVAALMGGAASLASDFPPFLRVHRRETTLIADTSHLANSLKWGKIGRCQRTPMNGRRLAQPTALMAEAERWDSSELLQINK